MIADRLAVSAEVAAALAAGDAVVALESTLISHGLPYPQNLEVANASDWLSRARAQTQACEARERQDHR